MSRLPAGLLVAGLVLLPACAEGDAVQRQAVSGSDGVQATGSIDGQRVAISSGDPDVVLGDCDPGDGLDRDLCMNVRTIDGVTLNLVIENPDAVAAATDGSLPVRDDACEAAACDEVGDHAVVDLRVAGVQTRASGSTITVSELDVRAVGRFNLRFPDGDSLVGTFDLRLG